MMALHGLNRLPPSGEPGRVMAAWLLRINYSSWAATMMTEG
jgi:hypothetical protein